MKEFSFQSIICHYIYELQNTSKFWTQQIFILSQQC